MSAIFTEYCTLKDTGEMTLDAPNNFNFAYDVVDRIAAEEPDRCALIWLQDESCLLYEHTDNHMRTFTFADMSRLSNQAANYLTSCGIKKGDRVMLMLKRHYAYWYVLLGLHKIGAEAMPAACMLGREELVFRMKSTKASAVVCLGEDALCGKVVDAVSECPTVRHLFCVGCDYPGFERFDTAIDSYPTEMARVDTKIEDPILLYFTSGTTGQPKIVAQDGTYPLAHIQTALVWQNVRDGGLHLSVADTGWGKASWGKIYGQWMCGSAVLAYDFDVFSAVRMLEVIRKLKVTTFCAPPTIYRFFVKNNLLNEGFGEVEYATTAGEAINPEIVEQFKKHTGLEIHAGYGQTESTLLVGEFRGDPIRPGSMGKPSSLYHPIIVDENGNECADEEAGEIVLPAAGRCDMGLCIRSIPDLQMGGTVWEGDLYRTGDIARRDKDGYFWFIGRVDDVFKSSGYRVSPFEVESVLIQHPAVMECAVTGVPDERRGFVVKATVVLREGYLPDRAMTNTLRDFVKDKTADYKVPRIIDYVDKLPRTFSGKIRHVEIRERDANNRA
ncbi:MAG: AMP-binding protein [Christensenellaceae bacterium]|nr:AMP-binding protein [Christensenellaceae bacterium]